MADDPNTTSETHDIPGGKETNSTTKSQDGSTTETSSTTEVRQTPNKQAANSPQNEQTPGASKVKPRAFVSAKPCCITRSGHEFVHQSGHFGQEFPRQKA